MNCQNCGQEFEIKSRGQKTKKFCSDKCRYEYHYQGAKISSKPMNGLPTTAMSHQPESVQSQLSTVSVPQYYINDLLAKRREDNEDKKRYEAENRELRKKLDEVEKELAFKDKEFELAGEKRELKYQNSLAGIGATWAQNPTFQNIAMQLLNNAMNNGQGQQQLQQGQNADLDTQQMEALKNWFFAQKEEVKNAFFEMMQKITSRPDALQIFKNITKKLSSSEQKQQPDTGQPGTA